MTGFFRGDGLICHTWRMVGIESFWASAIEADPNPWTIVASVLVTLFAVAPLASWLSNESDRRSAIRQLERWTEVAGGVSPRSAHQAALQEAIDERALALSLRAMAPRCRFLLFSSWYFGIAAPIFVVVSILTALNSPATFANGGGPIATLWWVLCCIVLSTIAAVWRAGTRRRWIELEKRKRTGVSKIFEGDGSRWRSLVRWMILD
jgi:hypothetical protein